MIGRLLLARRRVLADLPAQRHLEVAARTDAFNAAAERYFADYPNPAQIQAKPFSEAGLFARRLFDMGVLFHWARLSPGDVVLELGAGTCWLSHFLNLFGCKTLSVDVSPTALELGRRLFAADPRTRWELGPEFLTYSGRRLPLEDQCCDAIVVNDAFHHIPNPREILAEMARVLRPEGVVTMSEPGRYHSQSADSQRETAETGVLENDIVVEELAEWARSCGFLRTTVVPLTLGESVEVDARELSHFIRGRGLQRYWRRLCLAIDTAHYIVLYKGDGMCTTRLPGELMATVELLAPEALLRAASGEPVEVHVRLTNTGNTRWLAGAHRSRGRTCLGVHLYAGPSRGKLLDRDWFRQDLPNDVDPGASVSLASRLPALVEPGRYHLSFDLVVEGLTWFEQRGSTTLEVPLEVDGS